MYHDGLRMMHFSTKMMHFGRIRVDKSDLPRTRIVVMPLCQPTKEMQMNIVVSPTSLLEQVGRSFGALATSLPPEHFQAIATEESGLDSGPVVAVRMREHQFRGFCTANPEALSTT
jgi:hypothetical protein